MSPGIFEKRSVVDVSADALWRWHLAPGAFQRLVPPWQKVVVEDRGEGLAEGSRAVLRVKVGPFWRRWVALHRDLHAGRSFVDEQLQGPFGSWVHTHRFEPLSATRSALLDCVAYAPPLGAPGAWLTSGCLRRSLARVFAYRHAVTRGDLEAQARAPTPRPLRILVTGSHGLIGSALLPYLTTAGHEVFRLSRGDPDPAAPTWRPSDGRIDLAPSVPFDAVVHLAGENIAGGRWSDARKRRILESRTRGTRLLAETLAALEEKPRVFVTASGVDLYGDRGEEILDEESPPGKGFVPDVVRAWESSGDPAQDAGIRTVHLRFGMVLSGRGGALSKLLLPAQLGVGGPLGDGRAYWPWIAIDDVVSVILHVIARDDLEGGVNVVAPEGCRQHAFSKTLGRVLRRPAFVPTPAFALRLAVGEMADALLLASRRVEPRRLPESGYRYRWPTLEAALRHELGRTRSSAEAAS